MTHDPFRSEEAVRFTGDNIGDFLLNVLTVGLYNQPDLIVREYIQNSHDAICAWPNQPQPGRVDIRVDWPNIHIFDNGHGMDKTELLLAMSNIGKSFKPLAVGSGFMGIGKLAGVSMASRVEIHSSKFGVPEKNWVSFESAEMLMGIMERRLRGEHHSILETLHEHTRANEKPIPESQDAHYTSVHLLDINEDYRTKIENTDEFIKSIGLLAPVIQHPKFTYAPVIERKLKQNIFNDYKPIEIYVNGKPVYRPYIEEGLSEPKEIMVLDDNDSIIAYGWACLNTGSERYKRQIPDDALRGIALMQRGLAIGNRNLAEEMGLFPSTGNLIYFRWYTGELYIVDPRIIVTADRTRIRQSKDTLNFIEKVLKEFRKLAKYAETWANQDNAESVVRESIQRVAKIEEQVRSQPLTSDHIPRILSELGKTQFDVAKRKKYVVEPETKKQMEEVEKKVDTILDQLTTAQRSTHSIEQENMLPISALMDAQVAEVELFAESNAENTPTIVVRDIPERLVFSPRETQIYRTIMQAVADACRGRNSEEFMRVAMAIEKALVQAFSDADSEVV